MFIALEPVHYGQWGGVIDQMHRLRKKVFRDTLEWDVPIHGEYERDHLDDIGPAYLVWCDANATTLYGSMRLMPTTGPTLLYEVFSETFPDAAALSAPGIWEATRTCIHAENLARDHPQISGANAFGMMILAAVECALENGIHTVVSNYEPPLRRIYNRSGAIVEELGRAEGYGRYPVCCGAFEISERVVWRMRERLGIHEPIFRSHVEARQAMAA